MDVFVCLFLEKCAGINACTNYIKVKYIFDFRKQVRVVLGMEEGIGGCDGM